MAERPPGDNDEWWREVLGDPRPGDAGGSAEALAAPDRTVRAVAAFLNDAHQPIPAGPDASSRTLWEAARRRVDAGEVNAASFDPPYRDRSAAELLAAAERLLPDESPSALVLGPGGLDSFDLLDGAVVGWRIGPWGGRGDPAMDVAWVARSIAETIGPAFVVAFAESYGERSPGPLRAEFWITLGQLL